MIWKLRTPTGGAIIVLVEQIQSLEVSSLGTNADGVVHMANGDKWEILGPQIEEIEKLMGLLSPTAPSVLQAPAVSAATQK